MWTEITGNKLSSYVHVAYHLEKRRQRLNKLLPNKISLLLGTMNRKKKPWEVEMSDPVLLLFFFFFNV